MAFEEDIEMKLGNKFRKWTGRIFDMPEDVIYELPRMTMIGNRQLYIENHRGVKHFSEESLTVFLEKGELAITGQELIIRTIWTDEVFVEGLILNIEIISNEGGDNNDK